MSVRRTNPIPDVVRSLPADAATRCAAAILLIGFRRGSQVLAEIHRAAGPSAQAAAIVAFRADVAGDLRDLRHDARPSRRPAAKEGGVN